MTATALTVWTVCAATVGAIVARPFRCPEAVWAVVGAGVLVVSGLVPAGAALDAVARGWDVYLFLVGMMLLSETARVHGLFDWAAATAAIQARGSGARLFVLIYAAGVVTTIFLSNDATAVVLTPAVYSAAKKAGAEPLPLLFACALVANAASFVLPISNPANIVLYGKAMPPLDEWLAPFALPSVAAIGVTFLVLRWKERARIARRYSDTIAREPLAGAGKGALAGIIATAILLLVVSAGGHGLGLPTAIAGLATAVVVSLRAGAPLVSPFRAVAWSVLPLVAGLFVVVEALTRTGLTSAIAGVLGGWSNDGASGAAIASTALALASNLFNNLPAGLLASMAVAQAEPSRLMINALLIGVDLGPNLAITGSLATILWLQAIRREGEDVSFLDFLRVGAVTMPPALAAVLGARLILG